MLRFSQFLKEELLDESAKGQQGAASNSKGVAYETGLTAALNHNGKHPELHKDEHGMSPAEAHSHHSSNIHPDIHKQVKDSMSPSVEAIRNHLEKHHNIPKKDKLHTFWTSKPGQVSRVTGKAKDSENPGDLVVHHPKSGKHVSISAKFGEKPGLRSPGLSDLHHMAGKTLDHKKVESNRNELIKLGGKHVQGESQAARNKSFREAERDPKKSKTVSAINDKSKEHRASYAKTLASGMNKRSAEDKHGIVKKLLNADEHATPVIKVHYDTKKGKAHVSDPVSEFKKIKSKSKDYHFEHRGAYIHVHAVDKKGEKHHIASIGIKNNSSPMTHTVGSVSHGKHYHSYSEAKHD